MGLLNCVRPPDALEVLGQGLPVLFPHLGQGVTQSCHFEEGKISRTASSIPGRTLSNSFTSRTSLSSPGGIGFVHHSQHELGLAGMDEPRPEFGILDLVHDPVPVAAVSTGEPS